MRVNAGTPGVRRRSLRMTTRPIILVVEDQPLLLLHCRLAFEDAGYDVIQAVDADTALEALSRHPGIRTVFTDIAMPGSLNGLDLAALIQARWPDISVLVTSGAVSPPRSTIPPGVRFLPKPYTVRQLLDALASQPTPIPAQALAPVHDCTGQPATVTGTAPVSLAGAPTRYP